MRVSRERRTTRIVTLAALVFLLAGLVATQAARVATASPLLPVDVYGGYAGDATGGPWVGNGFNPSNPWAGSPGVTFYGVSTGADAAALRIVNEAYASLTFDQVTVTLGTTTYDIWPHNITVPAGGTLILTGTKPGASSDFDLSDAVNCSAPPASLPTPVINIGSGGATYQYTDTAQMLLNLSSCSSGLEGANWQLIGGVSGAGRSASDQFGAKNSAEAQKSCSVNTGDPVNCATGNLFETVSDLFVPGRGRPLGLTRTYNAQRAANTTGPDALGWGWTDSYAMSLAIDPTTHGATVTQESGATVSFAASGGAYVAPFWVLATLVKNGDGSYTFSLPDQRRDTFNVNGQLISETDRNGYVTTLSYTSGRVSTVTDPAGRSLSFSYDGSGRLIGVKDPAGRSVSYGYDTANNLTSVTDPAGNVTRHGYDASHRLTTMTDAKGGTTTNVYDASSRVVSQTDPLGRITTLSYGGATTTVTDPAGDVTTKTFDAQGNLVSMTQGVGTPVAATSTFTYDAPTGEPVRATDPNGRVTSLSWDNRGNLLSKTDPLGHKTTYTYDALNDRTSLTDPLGVATTYAYDGNGNLLSRRRPMTLGTYAGQVQSADPVSYWRLNEASGTTAVDQEVRNNGTITGGVTLNQPGAVAGGAAMNFDGSTGTVSLGTPTSLQLNSFSLEAWFKTAGGFTSGRTILGSLSYGYQIGVDGGGHATGQVCGSFFGCVVQPSKSTVTDNRWHHVVLTEDATNQSETLYLDGASVAPSAPADHQPTTGGSFSLYIGRNNPDPDPITNSTTYFPGGIDEVAIYDHALTASQVAAHYAAAPVLPTTQQSTMAYGDPSRPGDLTALTDPDGNVWSFAYDANGDLVRGSDPLGNARTYAYDVIGRRTSMVSPKGNVAGAYAANYTTAYTYDPVGDLVTTTDPLGATVTYTYDANRNRVSVTDPDHHTSTYTYDADNEVTQTTRPDASIQKTSYDADGNVSAQIDGLGHATTYTYDALNRLRTTTDPLGHAATNGYDPSGNLITVKDPLGQTKMYSYDAANQLIGVTHSDGATANVSFAYDPDGQRTSMADGIGTWFFGYDSLHRLTHHGSIPLTPSVSGREVGYRYDLAGELIGINDTLGLNVTRTYDQAGRMASVSDGLGNTVSFGYDADNNLTTETFPGAIDTLRYDNSDRIIAVSDTGAGATFYNVSYRRDAAGQLTAAAPGLPSAGPAISSNYTYDSLPRLTSVAPSAGSTTVPTLTYAYDAADRLTTLTTTTAATTFTYDAADQVAQEATTPTGGGTTVTNNFAYDAKGDRTQGLDSTGRSTTYTWDQENRLVAQSIGAGVNEVRTYDGDGLLQSGDVNRFTWDHAEGLPLMIKDGVSAYVTGPGGLPVEQQTNAATRYYHHDQLGSTIAMTDAQGHVVQTYAYDPYGKATPSNTAVANPFQFAGQYVDYVSGLIYMRARWYDPSTAQFLSVDPVYRRTLLRYGYVRDNPLNGTDPNGLDGPSGPYSCPAGSKYASDLGCYDPGTMQAPSSTNQGNGPTTQTAPPPGQCSPGDPTTCPGESTSITAFDVSAITAALYHWYQSATNGVSNACSGPGGENGCWQFVKDCLFNGECPLALMPSALRRALAVYNCGNVRLTRQYETIPL